MKVKKQLSQKMINFLQVCKDEHERKKIISNPLEIDLLQQCVRFQRKQVQRWLRNYLKFRENGLFNVDRFGLSVLQLSSWANLLKNDYEFAKSYFILKLIRFCLWECLQRTLEELACNTKQLRLKRLVKSFAQKWKNDREKLVNSLEQEIIEKFQTEAAKEDFRSALIKAKQSIAEEAEFQKKVKELGANLMNHEEYRCEFE